MREGVLPSGAWPCRPKIKVGKIGQGQTEGLKCSLAPCPLFFAHNEASSKQCLMIIDLTLECWVVLKARARETVSLWGQLHNHRNLGWSKNTANRRESYSAGKVLRQCTA